MSNPTLQMYKAKSLLVLLTLWTTGHALGCPRPTFLLSGISHTELSLPVRRSYMGLLCRAAASLLPLLPS